MTTRCPKCNTPIDLDDAYMGVSPAEWQKECEDAVFAIAELLARSGRRWAASGAIEILRSVPHSTDEKMEDINSLLYRCCTDVKDRNNLTTALADRLYRIGSLSPARRALLEAPVVGVLVGCGIGG